MVTVIGQMPGGMTLAVMAPLTLPDINRGSQTIITLNPSIPLSIVISTTFGTGLYCKQGNFKNGLWGNVFGCSHQMALCGHSH